MDWVISCEIACERTHRAGRGSLGHDAAFYLTPALPWQLRTRDARTVRHPEPRQAVLDRLPLLVRVGGLHGESTHHHPVLVSEQLERLGIRHASDLLDRRHPRLELRTLDRASVRQESLDRP